MRKFITYLTLSALLSTSAFAQTTNRESRNGNGTKSPNVVLMQSTDGTNSTWVNTANPLPVTVVSGGGGGGSTPTGSAGTPNVNVVSVQGISGATALPVTGTFFQATQPVSIAGTVTVTNPSAAGLTDTQLRATALPISGTVTATGPLTDTQLRATPVPVVDADSALVTGTITTQNLVPAGVATVGSAVEITPGGRGNIIFQVTGTYTGALTVQGTVDGTTWVTNGGAIVNNINIGTAQATVPSATQSIFQMDGGGYAKIRVTALAAVTGTATVNIKAADGVRSVSLTNPIPTGTNTIGAVNIAAAQTLATVTTVGTVTTVTTANIQPLPQTGLFINSAATTNATAVKASAGQLLTFTLSNNGAAAAFVKFYNKASAPTVGTDTPVMVVPVTATSSTTMAFGTAGQQFATGIALAVTNLIADSDTTAVVAGQVKIAVTYK